MKIGVSSYSFQRLIGAGSETQLSVIRRAAQLGFDAIEFTDLQPHDGSSEADYAAQLHDEAARCGIEISAYAVWADLLGGLRRRSGGRDGTAVPESGCGRHTRR